jgi:hypothetical protein
MASTTEKRSEFWIRDLRINVKYSAGERTNAIGIPMGRFGGGWEWNVGFQASTLKRRSGTVIFNLLVAQVSISWASRAEIEERQRYSDQLRERREAREAAANT